MKKYHNFVQVGTEKHRKMFYNVKMKFYYSKLVKFKDQYLSIIFIIYWIKFKKCMKKTSFFNETKCLK